MIIRSRNRQDMEFLRDTPNSVFGKLVCYDKNGKMTHYTGELHESIANYIISGELDAEELNNIIFYENTSK